jgi:hypothetical protein
MADFVENCRIAVIRNACRCRRHGDKKDINREIRYTVLADMPSASGPTRTFRASPISPLETPFIGDLNERIAEKLEELETGNINVEQRLERELKRDYRIITADKRLDQVARDFVQHYSTAWETGKAMLVCIDKVIRDNETR